MNLYMPHLSPMNWLFALTSITLILSMFMSNLWWNSKQKFNPLKNLKLPSSSKWSW